MAKEQTILRILVASPDDVSDERHALVGVVKEINDTWSDSQNIRLDVWMWEDRTKPGIGIDGQDVINTQIGNNYDIFIGIMWSRYGTATKRAESGTVEEFDRAYRRKTKSQENVEVMFYFKNAQMNTNDVNVEQLGKVHAFKKNLAEIGCLYHEFNSIQNFRDKVRNHLSSIIQMTKQTPEEPDSSEESSGSTNKEQFNPLANLSAITFDEDRNDDEGLIELTERAGISMSTVAETMNRMSDATTEVGNMFQDRTKEAQKVPSFKDIKIRQNHAKRISNKSANDLENYVQQMSAEITTFHEHHFTAMDSIRKVTALLIVDFQLEPEEVRNNLEGMRKYHSNIENAISGVSKFRNSISDLPRMTMKFNIARQRGVAVLDDLLVLLQNAEVQITETEDLLKDAMRHIE